MAAKLKYTSNDQSTFGIMSCVFGLLAVVTFALCIYKSYLSAGTMVDRFGTCALLAIIFMLVGYGLGIYSMFEINKFKLFGILGIIINTLAFFLLSAILYAGAMPVA